MLASRAGHRNVAKHNAGFFALVVGGAGNAGRLSVFCRRSSDGLLVSCAELYTCSPEKAENKLCCQCGGSSFDT
jgi:hypothetical protein